MFVMVAGRQQGKSLTILNWLMEQPNRRGILTSDNKRRQYLLHMLERLYPNLTYIPGRGYWSQRILVVDERPFGAGLRRFAELGIDDAETVLERMFNARVEFVTLNATLIPVAPRMAPPQEQGDFVDGDWSEQEHAKLMSRKELEA
jgi:hypothetical protein